MMFITMAALRFMFKKNKSNNLRVILQSTLLQIVTLIKNKFSYILFFSLQKLLNDKPQNR